MMPAFKTITPRDKGLRRNTQEAKINMPKLTAKNRINEYKKQLSMKKNVKVVKKRYRVFYFVQFWFIFIFLCLVNIFA